MLKPYKNFVVSTSVFSQKKEESHSQFKMYPPIEIWQMPWPLKVKELKLESY